LPKRTASVAASLALVLAGCGSSAAPSLSSFKHGFAASKAKFAKLGSDLGTTIEKAGAKTDVQLAAELDRLAARAKTQAAALRKLDPPAKFKSELTQLSSGLDSVSTDLRSIAGAANAHNATQAKSATKTLLGDATKVKAADTALTKQLGLPKAG
jgi:hypothetical protein